VSIQGPFDLVISNAVLEARSGRASRAITNLAGCMAPGAVMAHFRPCRNAPFAILNRCGGTGLAKRLLLGIYPGARGQGGVPGVLRLLRAVAVAKVCEACGLEVMELTAYFVSDYLEFFAPGPPAWNSAGSPAPAPAAGPRPCGDVRAGGEEERKWLVERTESVLPPAQAAVLK